MARDARPITGHHTAMPDLSVNLAPQNPSGLVLRNPVAAAAGTFGYGTEYARIVEIQRLGAIFSKGTTLRPQRGAPPPTSAR